MTRRHGLSACADGERTDIPILAQGISSLVNLTVAIVVDPVAQLGSPRVDGRVEGAAIRFIDHAISIQIFRAYGSGVHTSLIGKTPIDRTRVLIITRHLNTR